MSALQAAAAKSGVFVKMVSTVHDRALCPLLRPLSMGLCLPQLWTCLNLCIGSHCGLVQLSFGEETFRPTFFDLPLAAGMLQVYGSPLEHAAKTRALNQAGQAWQAG